MLNSNLNSEIPCGTQVNENDKRLDILENQISGFSKQFGTQNLDAETINATTGNISKVESNTVKSVLIDTSSANIDNLNVNGPMAVKDLDVTDNFRTKHFAASDKITTNDFETASAKITNADIDVLTVGQVKAKDSNTMMNDLTVAGTASVNKLVLQDPKIIAISPDIANIKTANISDGHVKMILGNDLLESDLIKLGKSMERNDNAGAKIVSFIDMNTTQLGDDLNNIVIAGENRPLWNKKALATLEDLGDKITPAYKGIVDTEADLPADGAISDYYIIKSVTIGAETGIGSGLWNGSNWDISIFYELIDYRNKTDQDIIDNAQNIKIENHSTVIGTLQTNVNTIIDDLNEETHNRIEDVNDLVVNGVDTHKAINISGLNLNINDLAGAKYFGKIYTGLGNQWVDGILPEGAEGATGFCLEILPNSHNTIQVYTINTVSGAKTWKRIFGNTKWSEWRKDLLDNDVIENAKNAELLNNKSLLELKQIFFDGAHPVNDTFVSNDGNDDPNTIYNKDGIASTWEYVGQSFGIHGWRRTK